MRLLPVTVLLLFSSAASAAPVLFDNRADFDAAVGEHQLFTDFALTHVPLTLDFAGDFGGLEFRREFFEIQWGETLEANGVHTEGRSAGLFFRATEPIVAIGFDVLDAWTHTAPRDFLLPGPQPPRVATDAIVNFTTTSGAQSSTRLAPGGFFGALLFDDTFAWLTVGTPQPSCICQSGLTIDNLAVKAVPEPATAILLGLGLLGIAAARRRRLAATR